jgi:hypothetical protein
LAQRGRWAFDRVPLIDVPGTLRVSDIALLELGADLPHLLVVASSVRGWELILLPLDRRSRIEPIDPPRLDESPMPLTHVLR